MGVQDRASRCCPKFGEGQEGQAIPDVAIVDPTDFDNNCGIFFESDNQRSFLAATGLDVNFVQDNHSKSGVNVLRGLHYQFTRPQGKLVRAEAGEVFYVAVDIRMASPTFGQWIGVVLSAQSKRVLWIPPGFSHGFLVTSHTAEVLYKTSAIGCRNMIAVLSGTILSWPSPGR